MKICVDIQPAIAQRAGVGRYTQCLVEHLGPLLEGDSLRLFYFDFRRRGLPFPVPGATFHALHWCPGRLAQWSWKTLSWPPFDRFYVDADVYHFPNFILPPLRRGAAVVTVHDMSFLRFPRFAENRNRRYLTGRIRDTVRRADAVITDSQFSAGEIRALIESSMTRIVPIYPGIGDGFRAPEPESVRAEAHRLGLTRPYLLTVGTLEPRKNIPFLVEVFERLSGYDGDLVIAGMPGWKVAPILERMATSRRAGRIRYLRYVDGAVLPALYAGADLFLTASVYEGFGFPPLEAMACGTPVISSRGGSLPEVLGDGALVVDGYEADAWA
jgi:glycosyltransferase involved in cell wall biosynthesis